jgi:choline dehydrogenase-like flavoprotein
LLGRFVAFHNYRGTISATMEGFEDQYYYGRRPTQPMMPSFRNVYKQETDFLRGYMVFFGAGRGSQLNNDAIGEAIKEQAAKPAGWYVSMMMQGETIPKYDNHVRLSPDQRDAWGIPQLITSIDYDDNDVKSLNDFFVQGADMLDKAGCKNIVTRDSKQAPGLDIHEMGGVRMGNDPKTSLLNAWNQIHTCKNVFVTDGAAMTSTGNQNPSLTFMALTARAANYAVQEMNNQNL